MCSNTPIVSIASIAQPAQTQMNQTQIISSRPIAIAANTTQGQQLALASSQQAGQILGSSQITLATGIRICFIPRITRKTIQ